MSGIAYAIGLSAEHAWVNGDTFRSPFRPGTATVPQPVELLALVERVSQAAADPDGGVVLVLGADALPLVGLPAALGPGSELEAAPDALKAAGWRVSALDYWTTCWPGRGRATVYVCVPAWVGPNSREVPVIAPDDLAATTARLAMYHRLAKAPYALSPGMAMLLALRDGRAWHRGRAPYWAPSWDRGGGWLKYGERDLLWESPAPPPLPYRHRYDLNTAYLGALALVEVAADQLQRVPDPAWDRKLSGVWCIEAPVWNHPEIPSPVENVPPDPKGRLWVTTPTLALLVELAEAGETSDPVIRDAWLAPGRRLTRGWAEDCRDALAALDGLDDDDSQAVRATIRATFPEGVGMLARSTQHTVYRPDWRYAVVAQTRVSLWRKMWTIGEAEGRWPVRVRTDCVEYGAHDPDPVTACPRGLTLGAGLGRFKVDPPKAKAAAA